MLKLHPAQAGGKQRHEATNAACHALQLCLASTGELQQSKPVTVHVAPVTHAQELVSTRDGTLLAGCDNQQHTLAVLGVARVPVLNYLHKQTAPWSKAQASSSTVSTSGM